MLEIAMIFRKKIPTETWEIVIAFTKSLPDAAEKFNPLKFYLATHGAGNANLAFMQPRTVFAEIQMLQMMRVDYFLSTVIGLYHIFTRIPSIGHWDSRPASLEPNRAWIIAELVANYFSNTNFAESPRINTSW
jgi:hypothetical protein